MDHCPNVGVQSNRQLKIGWRNRVMKAGALKSTRGQKEWVATRRITTTIEMVKYPSKRKIMYNTHSNNRERRLPIAAAASVREASSSRARSIRSGCLRTREEREISSQARLFSSI